MNKQASPHKALLSSYGYNREKDVFNYSSNGGTK